MGLYNTLARHVLAPSLDILRGTHTMRHLAELEVSQRWPLERIEQLQSERVRRLVEQAYAVVPYYRQLIDERGITPADIRTACELPLLPVLTKDIIRDKFDMLLARGFPEKQLLPGCTGGSTGTPLEFFSTRESQMSMGLGRALRALEWAGTKPGDRTVYISKERTRRSPSARTAVRLRRMYSRTTFIDAASLSDTTLPRVVRSISKARPRALIGYASAVHIVASFIRETGCAAPAVGSIITEGEQLLGQQRDMMRKVFGVEPFSRYSSFESFDIAMECEAHEGMHVNAEDLVVEVVDDDGRPLPEGREGRILVTDLHAYGMPFIRYDTGDIGSFVSGTCACGRHLPRLELSLCKTGDVIYTPSGKRLSPLALGASALAPLGIREFQFVQEELDHIVIRVVAGARSGRDDVESLGDAVAATFRPLLGESVRIEVTTVESIEPTAAGKHLFIVSKIAARGARASQPQGERA